MLLFLINYFSPLNLKGHWTTISTYLDPIVPPVTRWPWLHILGQQYSIATEKYAWSLSTGRRFSMLPNTWFPVKPTCLRFFYLLNFVDAPFSQQPDHLRSILWIQATTVPRKCWHPVRSHPLVHFLFLINNRLPASCISIQAFEHDALLHHLLPAAPPPVSICAVVPSLHLSPNPVQFSEWSFINRVLLSSSETPVCVLLEMPSFSSHIELWFILLASRIPSDLFDLSLALLPWSSKLWLIFYSSSSVFHFLGPVFILKSPNSLKTQVHSWCVGKNLVCLTPSWSNVKSYTPPL